MTTLITNRTNTNNLKAYFNNGNVDNRLIENHDNSNKSADNNIIFIVNLKGRVIFCQVSLTAFLYDLLIS